MIVTAAQIWRTASEARLSKELRTSVPLLPRVHISGATALAAESERSNSVTVVQSPESLARSFVTTISSFESKLRNCCAVAGNLRRVSRDVSGGEWRCADLV